MGGKIFLLVHKIDVRAGTVTDVKTNKKSRNPAYVVSIAKQAKMNIEAEMCLLDAEL